MSYYTLKDIGLTDLDRVKKAKVVATQPHQPFGWSLRKAITFLFDDYGVSPKRFAKSLRTDIAKDPGPMRRAVVPEPYVELALADISGGRLRDLEWSGSTCVEIVTDAIERYWWSAHKRRGLRPNEVPPAIAQMRGDCFGTRWDYGWWRDISSHFGTVLVTEALGGFTAEHPLRVIAGEVDRLERHRHYISQGLGDFREVYWPVSHMLEQVARAARIWEADTGGNYWDDVLQSATMPPWFRIYQRLGGRVDPSISAPEVIEHHIRQSMWQLSSQRPGRQTDEFLRWAVCLVLDDAITRMRALV